MRLNSTIKFLIGVALTIASLVATPSWAKPPKLNNNSGYSIDSTELHLFLASNFLENICRDRLLMAKCRYLKEEYLAAAQQKNWQQALVFCDSLIANINKHNIPGVQFNVLFRYRAEALVALGRTPEACMAYKNAIDEQSRHSSVEQNDIAREMQTTFELDRLALDQALLRAQHHRTTLIWVVILLSVAMIVVVGIYISNRRSKSLHRELLRQMDQAHASEKQKTAFINSMCHEVRTPLNCLSGFSELLCSGDITPDIYAEYHDIICDSRNQLRYVFDDMLEVAYLENLTESLPRLYINLSALCRTRMRELRLRYPQTKVNFTSNIPTDQIGMNSNEKYMSLLILELLDNGHKFSDEGSVHLECGREGADKVYIRVTNSGRSIPIEQQQRVFERFIKLDTFSQGNGLGLYLCALITRNLHGVIRIDPQYTQGTRIEVILPRK